jgi:hypothetical protein
MWEQQRVDPLPVDLAGLQERQSAKGQRGHNTHGEAAADFYAQSAGASAPCNRWFADGDLSATDGCRDSSVCDGDDVG